MQSYPIQLKYFAGFDHFWATPNELASQGSTITSIAENEIPTNDDAIKLFENVGGFVSADVFVGIDPLADRFDLFQKRDQMFFDSNPPYEVTFAQLLCGRYEPLQKAIFCFITDTMMLR
jgi:hypothetical protein